MKKRILIVDDESDLHDLLIYHLDDRQVEFHTATSCAEALAKAESVRPDLILLDILLPDVDGLTLCEGLRQLPATRHVPIAMMSAHDSGRTRQLALVAGANEFFSKPLKLADFKEKVRQLLLHPPAQSEESSAAVA